MPASDFGPSSDITFRYRPAPFTYLGLMLSCGVFGFAILHFASTYPSRIDPPLMFPLSVPASRLLIGFASVPFLVGAWVCLRAIRLGLDPSRQVILSDNALTVPKSFLSKNTVTLPYGEIGTLGSTEYRGIVFLKIPHHQHGVTITNKAFSNSDRFATFVNMLERKLAEHHKEP